MVNDGRGKHAGRTYGCVILAGSLDDPGTVTTVVTAWVLTGLVVTCSLCGSLVVMGVVFG